ncbi:hypothetical protein [Treponema sp.]|uniref:hypothetical protein n=1 Tax=Treponema sp. TaxID=166 RepID=UPI00257DFAD6|nr:hypothetical protein [Treponema sp.]MBE6355336.1 hypothetical protein [Treponema sp.]
MNKIFKILSILVIGFVMFSCSTPTNDPETPTPNPEVQTYSITFIAEKYPEDDQPIADLLNSLPDYNKVEKGKEVKLPTIIYETISGEYKIDEPKDLNVILSMNYEGNVTSVKVENENIKIKFWTTPAE